MEAFTENTPLITTLTAFLQLEPQDWEEAQEHLLAQQAFDQIWNLEMLLDQEAEIIPEIEQ